MSVFYSSRYFGIKATSGGKRERKKVAAGAKAAEESVANPAAGDGRKAEEDFTSELAALDAGDGKDECRLSDLEKAVSAHGSDVTEKALSDLLKGCGPGVPSPDGINWDPVHNMWTKNGKPLPPR